MVSNYKRATGLEVDDIYIGNKLGFKSRQRSFLHLQILSRLEQRLQRKGYKVQVTFDWAEILEHIKEREFDSD